VGEAIGATLEGYERENRGKISKKGKVMKGCGFQRSEHALRRTFQEGTKGGPEKGELREFPPRYPEVQGGQHFPLIKKDLKPPLGRAKFYPGGGGNLRKELSSHKRTGKKCP